MPQLGLHKAEMVISLSWCDLKFITNKCAELWLGIETKEGGKSDRLRKAEEWFSGGREMGEVKGTIRVGSLKVD